MKSVTNLDAVDRERFADSASHVPNEVRAMQSESEAFNDLLQDSFGALYKYAPLVQNDVPVDRTLNRHVVSQMMELAEYKQLRNFTVGDAANSAGALGIVKRIWDELPEPVKQAQENAEQVGRDIDDALDSDEYDPSVLEHLFSEAKQAEQELGDQVEEWQDAIRQAVRRVLAEAERDTANGEQALGILGWGREGGPTTPATAEDKLRVSKALKQNKNLQEIIRLAGRMTNLAQKKQRQKAVYVRSEVVGIEQGDDLSSVLPAEFGYLMHSNRALNLLFLKRFSQSELMQYEMESREPKAQGPVLVAIDCSGSMCGEPDTWSKACALAMYSIARKQRRDFGVILFNHRIVREVFIKKGEHKAADLMTVLTAGVGGGTSFEEPLGRALALIQSDEHKKADLIVITDGVCDITKDFQAQYTAGKKAAEFSCYTILIGGGKQEEEIAAKFSDSVTELNNMLSKNEGQAFDVVFNI